MLVWRLASGRHPPLSGEGARLVGGRWNSPGRRVVYASESLALCLAECLVHITSRLPRDYVAFKIEVPDDGIEYLKVSDLRIGWERDTTYTRVVGDEWLKEERSLALVVPSAMLPESGNVLLNPLHARASELKIISQQPFTFDPRFRPTS